MDLVATDLVFHERQDGALCAQHALNSLLQGACFTPVDLSHIAQHLDAQELEALADGASTPPSTATFTSQNQDDTGFFSIQVIQSALAVWNLTLTPLASPANASLAKDPASAKAYILNLSEHWITLRRFGHSRARWYNLNSMLDAPAHVSEFYLQALLSQLQTEGYDVFVVEGDLPWSDADAYATSVPVPPIQITERRGLVEKEEGTETSGGLVPFSGKGYSLSSSGPSGPSTMPSPATTGTQQEDPELAAAIAMSLGGASDPNDMRNDDLQQAIQMSFEAVKKAPPAETEAEMMR
ncbi:Josephin-domain-containing protein, partial [Chytriomyces sp. MP71]